jgi:cyclic pyranopterin phosphate synthase
MNRSRPSASFSHLGPAGDARMVDVGGKPAQRRVATASGRLRCARATIARLRARALPKGDVLTVAQVAAIQAAKSTAGLIPLCHPLALTGVDVGFVVRSAWIDIRATVRTNGPTGVEMEALTAVSVAALTLYDMCKAVDSTMVIEAVRLVRKEKS